MKRILLGIIVVFSVTAMSVTAQIPSPSDIENVILKSDVEFDV